MPPKFNSPKQELEQGLCGKFGWSSRYFRDETHSPPRWAVEVRWGIGSRGRVFTSEDTSEDSIDGRKKGHAAAAVVALAGLQELHIIEEFSVKPTHTVEEQFGGWFESSCQVVDGGQSDSWKYFWQCSPKLVGIDVEGNGSAPPVLVQVCVETSVQTGTSFGNTLCILEIPSANPGGGLSVDLQRLLRNDDIIKVFCDGTANADKRSLVINENEIRRDIVDLESLSTSIAGSTSVPRGLARVVNLAWPDSNTRVIKDSKDKSSVHYFVAIQDGRKPPPRRVSDMPPAITKYAAMDAWLTLLGYRGLQDAANRENVAFN
tara:strand:+ start:57444 stop:58397 length:954 start_codon:yes stop_codon:yes gene_type:complete